MAPLLLPVPTERLRTLVPAALAPGTLLQPDLPESCGALAVLACLSNLSRLQPWQGTPTRTGPTPSRAAAAASSFCRARTPNTVHRVDLVGDRSPEHIHIRFDTNYSRRLPERRPAPSRNLPRILRFAVQQAWLLRLVPAVAPFSRSAFLFPLMPSGITASSPARSSTPAPPAPRGQASPSSSRRTASGFAVHVVTCLRITSPEHYCSIAPQDRGGSGRAGSAGPPFPCSELGAR